MSGSDAISTPRSEKSGSDRSRSPAHPLSLGAGDARRRLDLALDSMSEAFCLFDADDRLVLYNRRYLEMFPFMKELGDLHGMPFRKMVAFASEEPSVVAEPEGFVELRMQRHNEADGTPHDIALFNGRWARVRERRTPDGGIVSTFTDVTGLKQSETRLSGAIAGLGEGFVLMDADRTIRMTNPAFRQMMSAAGMTDPDEATLDDVVRRAAIAGAFDLADMSADELVASIREAGGPEGGRLELPLADGGCLLVNLQPVADGGTVGIWTDVSEQKQRERALIAAERQLQQQSDALSEFAQLLARQARSDSLTGLPNRFALEEKLDAALQEELSGIWVLFLDCDQFRTINDVAGHATGDGVLREFAHFLRGHIHPEDLLVRLGGDEFAVLITEVDEAEALQIATGLIADTRSHRFTFAARSFTLGLSIGMVTPGPGVSTVSDLLAAADTSCYLAKEAGRGRIHMYRRDAPESDRETLDWAEKIRLALEEDRFALQLQAIGDGEAVVGYEALIRLVDEQGRIRSPANFLPAARRVGLMDRIDEWVCKKAVFYAGILAARPGPQPYISMNFGSRALTDPLFQAFMIAEIDAHPGVGRTLRVEITETDEINDAAALDAFLGRLRTRGIRLYLDDFGSGYNSFDLLKQLSVDGIKIDWTVTHDLLKDPIDEALIRAAVSIADSLGLEFVAEGVEAEPELARLKILGVKLFQGHYFHRAEPAPDVLGIPAHLAEG
ncbi:EAL domain-containing protein [Ancylobacter sp. 6x-1]|uniref:EAL domain-containing protein n=1 Tax=Ancylobacter crimeensis TaxID=2579147 RepID=A0ABT0D961_9HYPH|nr:EAL domain-containing protein [Ancylobacter crimeensis]MCK0196464.1 EAL domain-containing protein [Ancylobacter crimeensis]